MFVTDPVIGERIFLQGLSTSMELSHYVEWLNNPQVNSRLESRFVTHTLETVREFVEASNHSLHEYFFGIFEKCSGKHIGNIRLHSIEQGGIFCEIGIMIGSTDHWGQGFATESIKLAVKFGISGLAISRFGAGCHSSNIASLSAFRKAGFLIEKIIKDGAKISDELFEDSIRMLLDLSLE